MKSDSKLLLTLFFFFGIFVFISCNDETSNSAVERPLDDYRGIAKSKPAPPKIQPIDHEMIEVEEEPEFMDQAIEPPVVTQNAPPPPPPPPPPSFKVVSEERYIPEAALELSDDYEIEPPRTAEPPPPPTREQYNETVEKPWSLASKVPVSTFSIDADGGSYANVRRFLKDGQMPPVDAVRTEELINFFQYDYPEPKGNHPIALDGEITSCPWADGHKLLRIGLKGKHVSNRKLPAANFVFLIDVSGSMSSPDKLGLLKESFMMFADKIRSEDRISIVTYASSPGVLLPSTRGSDRHLIKNAIQRLGAGGSTNGAGGITEAYEIASANFIRGGNNRVILGTDGDFNVGVSSQQALIDLIEKKRETGIFLSVLGVGTGNYQEGKMEQLANHGNGTYEYLDDLAQARKVFVDEMGKFYNVAKDVKIQIKFNPELVKEYRLIGYENRMLNEEDFLDDKKDAGEMGIDQAVTALYELIPAARPASDEALLTVDFRYKFPDASRSRPLKMEVFDRSTPFEAASENTRFATAAAGYGLMLRDSEYKGNLTWDKVWNWGASAQKFDPNGYRVEFLKWVKRARDLDKLQ